jgi:hypothetical protein
LSGIFNYCVIHNIEDIAIYALTPDEVRNLVHEEKNGTAWLEYKDYSQDKFRERFDKLYPK